MAENLYSVIRCGSRCCLGPAWGAQLECSSNSDSTPRCRSAPREAANTSVERAIPKNATERPAPQELAPSRPGPRLPSISILLKVLQLGSTSWQPVEQAAGLPRGPDGRWQIVAIRVSKA
jgi:hypothetical protein